MLKDKLKKYHTIIKENNLSVACFVFTYNNIKCQVIFDPDYTKGFTLSFIKLISAETLVLRVINYFPFISNDKSTEFKRFFNFGNSPYGTYDSFFKALEHAVPQQIVSANQIRKSIAKLLKLEESESTYFKSLIHWDLINKKYSDKSKHKHRTAANLEKVRILFPNLYTLIKDKNISVAFTNDEHYQNNYQNLEKMGLLK